MSKETLHNQEIRVVDGTSIVVHHYDNGTVVDSPCLCFGHQKRVHSTPYCPWLEARVLKAK